MLILLAVVFLIVMWAFIIRRWWTEWRVTYNMRRFNETPLARKIAFETARELDRQFCFGDNPETADPAEMAEFDAFYAQRQQELDAEVDAWFAAGGFEEFLISTRSPIIALWKKRAQSITEGK